MTETSLATLAQYLPTLEQIDLAHNRDLLWQTLRRLLVANAPSGGAWLRGAIAGEIGALAAEFNLADRFIPQIANTGNAGIWLGADKAQADVIVVAHMDRPSYRVRDVATGDLYPICAIRFPDGVYRCGAKSMRYDAAQGQLVVGSRGTLTHDAGKLTYETHEGELQWYDTLTLDVEPTLQEDRVTGTGLDNCLGVVSAFGLATALRLVENQLIEANRRLLIVFSDQEEGIPEAYFGHGAARLTYAVPPPVIGCIIADGHNVNAPVPQVGDGASHGVVSAYSRGSVVPPNFQRLAVDLAGTVEQLRPGTVQMNTGYLSRSDDMPLGRWTQILGMVGAPILEPHTGEESASLSDVANAIVWLTYYTSACLSISPKLARDYQLHA